MSQEPPKKPEPEKQRKNERPLSLYPMTFDQAVSKIVKAKPPKPQKTAPTKNPKNRKLP